jgi:signal transduction histidine kinase
LKVPAGQLFERFRKGEEAAKSIGLGLAIVKEICEGYGWKILYTNDEGRHILEITFA